MTTVFEPLVTRKFSLPSRIVRSATAERIAMRDEKEGLRLGGKYAALAENGVGLIVSGHISAHPSGRLHPSMPSICSRAEMEAWRTAIAMAHKPGGTLFLQLNHGGGRCRSASCLNPLSVSSLPERTVDPMLGAELSGVQIRELIGSYAAAARNAREAGADGVQIHAAHGYLVSQFLSPLTNRRIDEWGGELENRARFLRGVVRAVRESTGKDFPLGVKLGCCDDDPAGLKIEESLQIAKWLEEDGLDFIEISGGFRSDIGLRRVGPGKNEGYYLPFAERFKKELKIPVFAVGGLRSLAVMNNAIALNQCDAVAMSRPLICQPDFAVILRAGGKSECRGCNLCLMKHDQETACHAGKKMKNNILA